VLEADSDHVDANYHMGVLYMQTDRPAEAVPHFEAALGQARNDAERLFLRRRLTACMN